MELEVGALTLRFRRREWRSSQSEDPPSASINERVSWVDEPRGEYLDEA